MYYVYILFSLKDFYTGYTTNLKNRLEYHKCGQVLSTSTRRPLKLIFYEAYLNKLDALRREKYFKSSAGKKALKIMIKETIKTFISHH